MANRNNYNKCCSCVFFKHEDAEGRGWCDILDRGFNVSDKCEVERSTMTDRGAVQALHYYQKWFRGADIDQPSPRIIGLAQDRALKALREKVKQQTQIK